MIVRVITLLRGLLTMLRVDVHACNMWLPQATLLLAESEHQQQVCLSGVLLHLILLSFIMAYCPCWEANVSLACHCCTACYNVSHDRQVANISIVRINSLV
jgi:hypothetical protein